MSQRYKELVNIIETNSMLKNYISKSGLLLKNNEWTASNVIDLSSMPQNEIAIISSSKGSDFSTNIKTLSEDSLLYGSIRPYFKKCGFCVDEHYVAGTVHSFNVNDNSYLLWILATICSDNFHKFTDSNSQGTKMPIINWETFCKYNLPIPTQEQLEEFNSTMLPLYNLVKIKMKESKSLKQQKELLLKKYFG